MLLYIALEVVGENAYMDEIGVEKTKAMIPNISIHEQLLFERTREWQCMIEQQGLQATLWVPRRNVIPHMLDGLGTGFVALGIRMKPLEQSREPSV